MMSHCIHSYICFILKPHKDLVKPGFVLPSPYNFPQTHLKRSRKNSSQRNFTEKNSFICSLDCLFPCGFTRKVLELILAAHEPRQGPPLKESPALPMWAFGRLAPCSREPRQRSEGAAAWIPSRHTVSRRIGHILIQAPSAILSLRPSQTVHIKMCFFFKVIPFPGFI